MYSVGMKLIQRSDETIGAEIVAARILNGIEHYQIVFQPDGIWLEPIWLSAAGVQRQFRPRESGRPRSALGRTGGFFHRLAGSF